MARKKTVKRGRKPGTKIGPYKPKNLTQMWAELKELRTRVSKLEKVLS